MVDFSHNRAISVSDEMSQHPKETHQVPTSPPEYAQVIRKNQTHIEFPAEPPEYALVVKDNHRKENDEIASDETYYNTGYMMESAKLRSDSKGQHNRTNGQPIDDNKGHEKAENELVYSLETSPDKKQPIKTQEGNHVATNQPIREQEEYTREAGTDDDVYYNTETFVVEPAGDLTCIEPEDLEMVENELYES